MTPVAYGRLLRRVPFLIDATSLHGIFCMIMINRLTLTRINDTAPFYES